MFWFGIENVMKMHEQNLSDFFNCTHVNYCYKINLSLRKKSSGKIKVEKIVSID